MQFKFWGICAGCGKLVGDATELTDFKDWARSRNINPRGPHGARPVNAHAEQAYQHHPEYVLQKDIAGMFNEDPWDSYGI